MKKSHHLKSTNSGTDVLPKKCLSVVLRPTSPPPWLCWSNPKSWQSRIPLLSYPKVSPPICYDSLLSVNAKYAAIQCRICSIQCQICCTFGIECTIGIGCPVKMALCSQMALCALLALCMMHNWHCLHIWHCMACINGIVCIFGIVLQEKWHCV